MSEEMQSEQTQKAEQENTKQENTKQENTKQENTKQESASKTERPDDTEKLKERLEQLEHSLEYKEALIEGQKALQDFCKQRDSSFDYELTKQTFLEKIQKDPSINKRYGYGEVGAFQFWLDFVKPNATIMNKKPQAPARFKELEEKAKKGGLGVDEQAEYLKMLENY